jgi:hypothetical protein
VRALRGLSHWRRRRRRRRRRRHGGYIGGGRDRGSESVDLRD